MARNIGIYLFDEIEVLDLGEPFEEFSKVCKILRWALSRASFRPKNISCNQWRFL
jgi:hypothetical protein